jgi:oligopeptide transport system substrate-binding protein
MRVLTKGAALAGVAALSLVVTACGGSSGGNTGSSSAGKTGGDVSISGCDPQNPFLPADTNEVCGGDPLDAITAKLVRYDNKTAAPILNIASSITTSDNINWDIKLKSGWKFTDGTPVTASSFVDAWNWDSYGPNAQNNSSFFAAIKGYDDLNPQPDANGNVPTPTTKTMSGLQVVNDNEFKVTMSSPQATFKTQLGYTAFAPLPKSFFADNGASFGAHPIGAGPYEFVSYNKGQSIVVKKNPNYQGDNKPKVDQITWKIYTTLDAAYADLQANNLDIMATLPSSALVGGKYKTDLQGRVVEEPSGTFQSFTFPMYDPQYGGSKNVDLRKAISEAVDRETIVKTIFNSTRVPADGWVSPVVNGYKAGVCGDACVFSADKAKADYQKWESANGGPFQGTMTLSYNSDGGHKEWVDATCNSIKNTLGIDCQGKPYVDFKTLRKDVTAHTMTGPFRTGWQMDYPAMDDFLVPLYQTKASSNDGLYSNTKFDDLMNQAAAATSSDQASKLYNEGQQVLAQDMPVVPLWYSKTIAGYSDKVGSVQFTPFGTPDPTTITLK